MTRIANRFLAIVLSFAMILTGFTFLGGSLTVNADGNKPGNVVIYYDVDSYGTESPQNQPAKGGVYKWLVIDGVDYYSQVFGLVDADDFKLQTKKPSDSDWTDSTVGSITLAPDDANYNVVVTGNIPDNTDTYDKMWRLVYIHSDPSMQIESCDSNWFTQIAADGPAVDFPAIKNINIDTDENQPAEGGEYAWFFAGEMNSDFEEVPNSAFSMQVKVGDGDWTDSSVAAIFELGTNYDEGTVTAAVPDNTDSVVKQWRFKYAGESVECPPITQAAKEGWNEACFTFSEDYTVVTGLTEAGTAMITENPSMVIPSSHNGVAITAIGDKAFENAAITAVQFPNTLQSIGTAAFNGCTALENLVLPASLETIGQQAFNNSTNLKTITFEDGIKITEIPTAAFQKVTFGVQISEIIIPNGVTAIGANAFGGSQVENLSLPSSLRSIDQRAFMNNKLSSFTIPKNVISIGNMAFSQQNAKVKGTLTTLSFEDGSTTTTIGKQAFDYAALTNVNVPSSVTSLDSDTFKNNTTGKVVLNLVSEDQFNGTGDYSAFAADGSGHRSSYNGTMNYLIKFNTGGRSTKNNAYTKNGVLNEADLAPARSNKPYDVFDGWFTEAEGGTAVGTDTTFTEDATLYAHWSDNTTLPEAESAVEVAKNAVEDAKVAAATALETQKEEDVKTAENAIALAKDKVNEAKAKIAAAEEFANTHSISAAGTTRINTANKDINKADAAVAKMESDFASKAASDAADAAAKATPGTQDAVNKADAAKTAADEAVKKAEVAKEAAEKAYGKDSDEAKAASEALDAAKTAAEKAAAAKTAADKAKTAADKAKAAADEKAAADKAAAEKKAKSVKTVVVNTKTVNAAAVDKAVKAAGGSNKYVKKIVIGKKVKTVKSKAFKKYSKVTVLEVKTKNLKKKSVKNSLKGSKIKTVKVKVAKKAKTNKKYVKKYKKIFTKKNAGKKVTVKK